MCAGRRRGEKGEGNGGGRKGKATGKGEPEEGKERREGDKSPAWSSQELAALTKHCIVFRWKT